MASLTSLPSDILIDSIIPLLSVKEFLNLSVTCKAFFSLAYDEVYWRKLTISTFRLPAQPLRENGWRELYKNLNRATLFTWGSNDKGRLGHDPDCRIIQLPMDVDIPRNQVAVDVVMGGWSTTILTSSGSLYSWGSLKGSYLSYPRVTKLQFPTAYSSTNIVEVSSGRSHVLGLSEDGRIWSWSHENKPGNFIKFIHVDTRLYGTRRAHGTIERIGAGWNHSAALVNGVGIVVWFPHSTYYADEEGILVDGEVVPGTCYIEGACKPSNMSNEDWEYAKEVGEVIGFMAGELYLIFLTKPGKVYAVRAEPAMVAGIKPVQLSLFSAPEGEKPMTYISGSFRKFAVFNSGGLVYIGTKDQLQGMLGFPEETQRPRVENSELKPIVMPSLQKRGIVAIAFGDYHSLALTVEGKVLSWGTEPMMCGCLGHGSIEVARRKGMKISAIGELDEPTEVGFDWFESNNPQEKTDNKYFIFNISAAGWHSGALALAPDREWRERTREVRLDAVYGKRPVNLSRPGAAIGGPTRTQPPRPHLPYHPIFHVPGRIGHAGVPPGEMGHGPKVRQGEESPVQRGDAIPNIISSNPSPFISHGPVGPAPGALPNPRPTTGGALLDDRRREQVEQERRRNQGGGGQDEEEEGEGPSEGNAGGSSGGCSAL